MKKVGKNILLTLCLMFFGISWAEEIVPVDSQTILLRGSAEIKNGMRLVTGDKNSKDKIHGPMTYYTVPYTDGTFSLSWKVEEKQKIMFVFDEKGRKKLAHCLKVVVNGSIGKKSGENDLTFITYDGSTIEKKKAKIVKHEYHAAEGQWHTFSITFEGNKATVTINDKIFIISSEKFRKQIVKSGIGHYVGTLQTKDVKVNIIK